MSAASFRNLGASVRERDRRIALSLDSPGTPGVAQAGYLMPSWDAFYDSLRQGAGEGGYRLSGNGSSLGGDPSGSTTRPGDADIARTLVANDYLSGINDQRKGAALSLRAMTQGVEAQDQAARDRQTTDRALAIANTPGVSQTGRPIAQREDGGYTTMRPNPAEPQEPVNRQAIAAQMAPGLVAPPAPAPPVTFGAPTAAMVNGKRVFVRAGSDGQMYGTDRRLIDAAAVAPDADQNEPLVSIMGPDNRPVLVRRSEAIGKTPASSREQGRPVTSGDAGRIADLDTSLSDLGVLRQTLTDTKGSTGTSAAIGASMPAAVTDIIGWGTDAKKRQGTIDRVKQVIGKALEGGVLRKEDEIKYEKILPNIRDTQDVATSKLDGLEKALIARRQTTFDSLKDAGYETSQFEKRHGAGAAPAGAAPGGDAKSRAADLIQKYGGG